MKNAPRRAQSAWRRAEKVNGKGRRIKKERIITKARKKENTKTINH